MPDPQQRVTLESIDWSRLVAFPRIGSAITMAMQPPRLILGLFMVVLLFAAGNLWDRFTEPRINPMGLTAGPVESDQLAERQSVMKRAVMDYVSDALWPEVEEEGDPWPELDVKTWLPRIVNGYRYERLMILESDDPHRAGLVREADAAYLRTIERIESVRLRGTFEATTRHVANSVGGIARGVVFFSPVKVINAITELFVQMPVALWREHRLFLFLYGVYFLFVLAICGGALSRMAVMEFAGQERMRLREALDFSIGNWVKLMIAPAVPIILAASFCGIMMLLGLSMTIPWIDVLGGVLYGLALLFGLFATLLVIVYAATFHLILPCVASENGDIWDAQQRSYVYVLSRPGHWLGYAIVGIVGLAIGLAVVSVVAAVLLNLTAGLFSTLTTNSALTAAGGFSPFDMQPRIPGGAATQFHDGLHNRAAAWLVESWQALVVSLVAAYVLAYYFAASSIAYLLLRRACDGQDTAEVWRPGLIPGTLTPMVTVTKAQGASDDEADADAEDSDEEDNRRRES